jgi:NitT/TauT family transport system substrate-binding protein
MCRARGSAAALIAVLLLGACRGGADAPLVLAAVRQPSTGLVFAAEAAGCFRTEGLTVEERPFALGRDALALLRQGGADAAVVYATPLVRAASADPRLRVLTTLHLSTRNTRLVTPATSGIWAFADLPGKRVGLARGTNADFYLELVATLGGFTAARVQVVDLAPEESVRALSDGRLDAAVLSDPAADAAERLLGKGARALHTDVYTEASLLVTRADVLAERPAALNALLRGLACGESLARARPREALAAVGAKLPEVAPDVLRDQLARVTWRLGLDHALVELLREERDRLLRLAPGEVPRVDLTTLLEPGPLAAADPSAVTLLTGPAVGSW